MGNGSRTGAAVGAVAGSSYPGLIQGPEKNKEAENGLDIIRGGEGLVMRHHGGHRMDRYRNSPWLVLGIADRGWGRDRVQEVGTDRVVMALRELLLENRFYDGCVAVLFAGRCQGGPGGRQPWDNIGPRQADPFEMMTENGEIVRDWRGDNCHQVQAVSGKWENGWLNG